MNRGSRKERPVNVLAAYVVSQLLQEEREREFERHYAHRSAIVSGPSLRDRIASAAAGLRRLVGSPAQSAGVLPKLEDYPYRS
jgi:hypothetical protein